MAKSGQVVLLIFLMTMASPAFAAWPDVWQRTHAASEAKTLTGGLTGIKNNDFAVLDADTSVASNDNGSQLQLRGTNGHTVCLTTDRNNVGNGTGTLTIEVFWSGEDGNTALDTFHLLETLSTSIPCVYDVPAGEMIVRAGAASNSASAVTARGNPDQ